MGWTILCFKKWTQIYGMGNSGLWRKDQWVMQFPEKANTPFRQEKVNDIKKPFLTIAYGFHYPCKDVFASKIIFCWYLIRLLMVIMS